MDFQKITQEKYLQYFLSDCEHSISDTMMIEFLDDMIWCRSVWTHRYRPQSSLETQSIQDLCSFCRRCYNLIKIKKEGASNVNLRRPF